MQTDSQSMPVPLSNAEALIAAHDGDVALVYLYILARGSFNAENAARELCRTMGEIQSAYEKLCRMGLVSLSSSAPTVVSAPGSNEHDVKLPPPEELPQYSAEDITVRTEGDPTFSAVLTEAQRALGHILGSADLKKLYGMYDYLALPPEVLLTLINHCIATTEARLGMGRKPSMHQIEKEAYSWVRMEIMTLERAEDYIRKAALRRDDRGRICYLLGIGDRELAPTERSFIDQWLDMGITEALIAEAYDKTLTNTGALKWSYMNKILQSWHQKGIREPADIRTVEPPKQDGAKGGSRGAIDIDALRKELDKM